MLVALDLIPTACGVIRQISGFKGGDDHQALL